jgi:hypothetical protein
MNDLYQIDTQSQQQFWRQHVSEISKGKVGISLKDIPFQIDGTSQIVELVERYRSPEYGIDGYAGSRTTKCCATGTCTIKPH